MPANYPVAFDAMSDPSANLSGPPLHSTMHNQINDVIEAMQIELGLNPSGPYATVAAAISGSAWTAVTFVGTWVNFGGGEQNVQYRKVGDMVYIRGVMKSGTIGTSAFNLPAGFRPPTSVAYATSSAGAFGNLVVAFSGDVSPMNGSAVSFHTNVGFSTTA